MGAIYSVLFALIAIFLYILIRFRNVAFSVGSTVALAFDALTEIGFVLTPVGSRSILIGD